jgi:ABC-type proline/glycine betaine transport system ATPase subunit
MVALYRLVELHSGSIIVDGVDISKLGLADVRSSISIIPQDPVSKFRLFPNIVYTFDIIFLPASLYVLSVGQYVSSSNTIIQSLARYGRT